MHKLTVTFEFQTHTKAQAKFILKQLYQVRKTASKLSMTHSSKMDSSIIKMDNPVRKIG
jgi:hypothetical protein